MLFRLPYALFVNLLSLLVWPLIALRRARAVPKGAWLTFAIDGSVVEVARKTPFWDRRPQPPALHTMRRIIDLAIEDARVTGILVTLEALHASSATATSVRELLERARDGGKRVAVYLPCGGGTRLVYVAMAADLVLVGPETHLTALGFAVQAPYLRDALDKVGIEPDVFARGRYKTAAESLVLNEMSEAQREQVGALLDASWESLVGAISEGRRVDRGVAEEWIDTGPWSAAAAVQRGLADAVCYPDEVEKKLEPKSADGAILFDATRYARRRVHRWRPIVRPKSVAVVEVHGAIVSKSATAIFEMADEEHVGRALTRVREDPRVRGVILHVDSRGGSALASDRILHAVRRVAREKPVVAYLGDVAASGGYMIAVGAKDIVAQPTTITGSIGVVAARPVVGALLGRLGIGVSVVKRGARADMGSPARHLEAAERSAVEQQLDDIYRSFLRVVAEGRNKTVSEIEPLAGGRVWTGRDAARHALVDTLGGFDVALARVRERIGSGAAHLEPVVVPTRRLRSPLAMLAGTAGDAGNPGSIGRWLTGVGLLPVGGAAALAMSDPRETAWAWSPIGEGELPAA